MTDNPNDLDGQPEESEDEVVNTPADDENSATGKTPLEAVPEDVRQYIKDLRKEAKAHRLKAEKLEADRHAAEQQRLEDEGKWQELALARQQELDALQPIAARYDQLVANLEESNQQRIEAIPESMRTLVPAYDDPELTARWLDANADKLKAPRAPDLDGGTTGDRKIPIKLTPEQEATARRFNMTNEEYANHMLE